MTESRPTRLRVPRHGSSALAGGGGATGVRTTAPRHAAIPPRRRRVWPVPVTLVVAVVGGVAAAAAGARWSDERVEVLAPPITSPAQELPVLVPVDGPGAPSAIGGQYALEPFAAATQAAVLADWGVAPAPAGESGADGSVATDGAVPHAGPCGGCSGTEGVVLGGRRDPPANAVLVLAYPRPGDTVADECGFPDVEADELPVAIVTGNPGEVELRVAGDRYVVESDGAERDEWEAWMDGPAGPRPTGSLVAHCVAVPAPTGGGPVVLRVRATDGTGRTAEGVAAVVPQTGGRPPIILTPLDATLLAVEVPLPTRTATASVTTGPAGEGCGEPGDPAWRPGSQTLVTTPTTPGDRPYLASAPAAVRQVVAVAEGEPTQVCVRSAGHDVDLVVTPPDARRLTLAVTNLDVPPGVSVEVEGTFAQLGWVPCRGVASPGRGEVVLCESEGDSGAIQAAGGLLDLSVRARGVAALARIPLSAAPGGRAEDVYRLRLPGDVGTVEVAARWDEGATGAGRDWLFDAAGPGSPP